MFINLANYYGKRDHASRAVVNSQFHFCTNLIPRPMILVFGLGTRLYVQCVQIWKWRTSQRTANRDCCEWFLRVNLKLWRHWVVVELYAMISISFMLKWQWVLKRDIIVEYSGRNKNMKKWHFRYRTLLRSAVFYMAFGHLYESCLSQRHIRGSLGD